MGTNWIDQWVDDDKLDDLSQTVVQQAHQARHVSRGARAQQPAVKRGYLHTAGSHDKAPELLDLALKDSRGYAGLARRS